jgi:DNA-directed RNA polymerase
MIMKPNKWVSPTEGGYYLKIRKDSNLIKTSNENYMEDLCNLSLDKICEATNALQETPWQINGQVLEVVKYLYEKGAGSDWGLPNPDGDELPPCTVCDLPFEPGEHDCFKEDSDQHREWKRKAAKVYDRNHRTRGKTKTVGKQLYVAEKFKDENEIYFVHTLDWRGRAYPVGSFLHPQADDVAKGLLRFAVGKEIIGKDAVREWKRHGANCFGWDKLSIEGRLFWIDENHQAILDSAADPLTNKLWTEADKPYQFLAFCFDYYGYHKEEGHVSQLPVSMDGACNGLQNFSAMLRDEVGGSATNIVSNGERKDIYEAVAEVIKVEVRKDAWDGRGHDEPVWDGCDVTIEQAAQAWDGEIDRQICKRGVMTMPYGSKRFGMRSQIESELEKEAIEKKRDPRLGEIEDTMPYSHYLSGILYNAIRQVVIAAGEAMDYLQDVAEVVAKHNLPLKWVSPAGFVVVQDYKNNGSKKLNIIFGGFRWRPRVYWKKDSINPRKQSQGISPNFVHSLDAAHMMLTVLGCKAEGVESFGMIHDSFATHAADATTMQRVLREAFVEMYDGNMLADFRDQIVAQLPEELAEEVASIEMPATYNLKLEDVLNSPYFFA